MDVNVRAFGDICLSHIDRAGGKSTSLREIVGNLSGLGVRVPDGFATTAEALKRFIGDTGLAERISPKLRDLDTDDTQRLAGVGREIREEVAKQRFPEDLECEVRENVRAGLWTGATTCPSRTRQRDSAGLLDASFAGQLETFLKVKGFDGLLQAIREVFASLYNDRAIACQVDHDFDHDAVALSAGVRQMVRSDIGASGVRFTMDTEPGLDDDMTQLTLGLNRGPFPWLRPSSVDASLPTATRTSATPRCCSCSSAPSRLPQGRQVRRHLWPGPRDHPDVTELPLEQGIESRSLNPDTVGYIELTLAPVQTMHQFRNQGGT